MDPGPGAAARCWSRRAAAAGCPRDRSRSSAPNASTANLDTRDVRCVERPEGCVWCEGRGPMPPLVDPDAVPPSLCDPKDHGNCVDFCSRLAPECAVPWRTVPSCLLPSEQEFRRELIRRDTADRPEALVQGRITDEAGRRIEGAKISVWFQGTSDRRGGLGQGRQLSPARCARDPGRISCASAARRWRRRSPTCASRSRGRPRATSGWRPRT